MLIPTQTIFEIVKVFILALSKREIQYPLLHDWIVNVRKSIAYLQRSKLDTFFPSIFLSDFQYNATERKFCVYRPTLFAPVTGPHPPAIGAPWHLR